VVGGVEEKIDSETHGGCHLQQTRGLPAQQRHHMAERVACRTVAHWNTS